MWSKAIKSNSIIVGIILLGAVSFQGKKPSDYSKILPGVVKVSDHLYYDETEASNFWWLEYMHYTATKYGKSSEEYKAVLPDTNVWSQSITYNQPYVKYYLRHEAYRDYPVVGISWEQARDYCTWRTERVEEALKANGKREKAPQYFQYRLPTIQEWNMMYEDVSKLSNVIGEEGKKTYRGMARFNMKRNGQDNMGVAGKLNDNADITAPVKSYWPNQFEVYNIKGNVSEWLMEEGKHVGGAWNLDMESEVSDLQTLDEASASVGFRCVCEIIDEAP